MSDEKPMIESIVSLLDKEVQNKIYDDLLHDTMINCGQALKTVSEFVCTPLYLIKLCNERARLRFNKCMRQLQIRLADTAIKDDVLVPPIEIAQPILDEIIFIDDERLSQMFIELLSKACHKRAARQVHRGFVTTLREMVPDEAVILNHIPANHYVPFVRFMFNKLNPLSDRITGIENEVQLAHPDCIALYLENLNRIGVIQCRDDIIYNPTSEKYNALVVKYHTSSGGYVFDEKQPFVQHEDNVFWIRGTYTYTEYGKLFRVACCSDAPKKTE